MKNRNFAKLENDSLTYAPSALTIGGYIVTAPTAAQYAALDIPQGEVPALIERVVA